MASPHHGRRSRLERVAFFFTMAAATATLACSPSHGDGDAEGVDTTSPGESGTAGDPVAVYTLSNTPVVSIGETTGQDEYLFGRIIAAAWLADGSIAVADAQLDEIRLFSATGEFLRRVGRKGHGPGEFGALSLIAPMSSGGFAAYDSELRRITMFAIDGDLQRTWQVRCLDGDGSIAERMSCGRNPIGLTPEAALFFATDGPTRSPPPPYFEGPTQESSKMIFLYLASETGLTMVDSLPKANLTWIESPGGRWFPFLELNAGEPKWASSGAALVYGFSTDNRVRVWETGTLTDIDVSMGGGRRESEENVKALEDYDTHWYRGRDSVEWRGALRKWLARRNGIDQPPLYGGIIADGAQRTWLRDYQLPDLTAPDDSGWWTIFEYGGQPAGRIFVNVPGRILSATQEAVMLRTESELGAQRLQIFGIVPRQ